MGSQIGCCSSFRTSCCTKEQGIVTWGVVVSKEELVEAQGADGTLSAGVGKIVGMAVNTGNVGRHVC